MPYIKWMPSTKGGWFFVDEDKNYWHMSANRETVTVTTPDGDIGEGWTEEVAWNALHGAA